VFPAAHETLKAREGTLAKTPFALLLHALLVEERTCTLELTLRNLNKRIIFEDGAPVGCTSNLLHETLGKYLVGKGKLTEDAYQATLAESVSTGKQMGALLVEKQLLSAFELFRHLQANLALKILDVFRWTDATWRLGPETDPGTPIRMNTAQLVFTGCAQLPDQTLAAHFPLPGTQRLALVPGVASPQEELKLSPKDMRVLQLLKARPALREVLATPGLDHALVHRRLFAWCVLGMVDLAERVDAMPPPAAPPKPTPPPEPPKPEGLPYLDDDERAKNVLAGEFLAHRGRDPFDLLGVPVTVQAPALQKAFLAKVESLPPQRFRTPELKQKAEALLLAWARAFGALSEPESFALHRKRREVAEERLKGHFRPGAAEQFRIRTDLLDADTQFAEGRERFAAGNYEAAAEFFEYACDIEPRGRFRAYLLMARYRLAPDSLSPRLLEELQDACNAEPTCEEAWGFCGDIALALGDGTAAEEAYRKAYKLNPDQKRYADAIRDVLRARTKR